MSENIRGILELLADALIAILRKLIVGESPSIPELQARVDRTKRRIAELQSDYALTRGDR